MIYNRNLNETYINRYFSVTRVPATGRTSSGTRPHTERDRELATLRYANELHATKDHTKVIHAAHKLVGLYDTQMPRGPLYAPAAWNIRVRMRFLAHSDDAEPHRFAFNHYWLDPAKPLEHRGKKITAWEDVGDALAYYEAMFLDATGATPPPTATGGTGC